MRRLFQSTLPARGATTHTQCNPLYDLFQSTLPARGATRSRAGHSPRRRDFNPRSPHGERQSSTSIVASSNKFQSTLPARGATRIKPLHRVGVEISIHAPRTGSDSCHRPLVAFFANFNPRSPHGERHEAGVQESGAKHHFNPRSPHGERPSTLRAGICPF